jgi:predicted RNA-binding protein YlxR (DUF448 family)
MNGTSYGSDDNQELSSVYGMRLSSFTGKHRPVRTCLGCRERMPQEEMLRIQMSAAGVVIVERRAQWQGGRSVYLCPKLGCLDNLLRRGEIAFKRSKYDKIIVRLEPRQAERLRFVFKHAARRLRATLGVGPRD